VHEAGTVRATVAREPLAHEATPEVLVVANLGLGEKFVDHAGLYQRALSRHFSAVRLVDVVGLGLGVGIETLADTIVVMLDKDVALAEAFALAGARVVNDASTIAVCDDKRRTYLHLGAAGLLVPRTILLPPVYPKQRPARALVEQAVDELGLPLVIKEAKGSFGREVYLATNLEEVLALTDQLADRRLLAQEFVRSSFGQDLRLQVVDGEVVAAMRRVHPRDFRANLSGGGVGYPHRPTPTERAIAIASARAVGGFNVGVDLLLDDAGEGTIVCEVNSNAHIWRLSAISGVDVADRVARALRDTWGA
jgi:RimK family alpha-L-glutamate ligase